MPPFRRFLTLRLRDSFDWSLLREEISGRLQESGFSVRRVIEEDEGFLVCVVRSGSAYEIGFRFDVSSVDEGGVAWIQKKRSFWAGLFASPEAYTYPDLEEPLRVAVSSIADVGSANWQSHESETA